METETDAPVSFLQCGPETVMDLPMALFGVVVKSTGLNAWPYPLVLPE